MLSSIFAPAGDPCHFLTVQLDERSYLHECPSQLREVLVTALTWRIEIQVTIACKSDYKITGQTVEEFIRTTLPASLLLSTKGRIRVSHVAFISMLGSDLLGAVAQAEQCGDDPWDQRRVI